MVRTNERNRFTASTKAKTNWEKKNHIPGTETKSVTNTYESESRWILHDHEYERETALFSSV